MSASRYRNFMKLCEKWPVDQSRGSRDLGSFVRKNVMSAFSKAEASVVNEVECDKIYASLQNIVNDVHQNKWKRSRVTNATGSSAESLSKALSMEGLQELGVEGSKSTLTLMKDRISSVLPGSKDNHRIVEK